MSHITTLRYRLRIALDDAWHRIAHWYEHNFMAVHAFIVGAAFGWMIVYGIGLIMEVL